MSRARKLRWILPATFIASAAVHPLAGLIYEAQRPPRRPRLTVTLEAEGKGAGVVVSADGQKACAGPGECSARFVAGQRVSLTATVGERSTFLGWGESCGPQAYRAFRWIQGVAPPDATAAPDLAAQLSGLAMRPIGAEPLECTVVMTESTTVTASFGEQPDEVEVAWLADDPAREAKPDDLALPDPAADAVAPPPAADAPEPPPPDQPIELALAEPPPPAIPLQPAPSPPPAEEKKTIEVQASRLKAVEVPDENEADKAPDDATFLSDKNRDVTEETVAKDTNLEREQKGEVASSSASEVASAEVGGAEDEIAQLESTEATALEVEREAETVHSGEDSEARGVEAGDEGDDGEDAEGGDGRPSDKPGLLSMRGIEGRGSPGGPVVDGPDAGGAAGRPGDGGREGRAGKRGKRGIKTQLEFDDYQRIVGDDKATEEVALARRTTSERKGRWEKKLGAIKSSLENFTPEVRTGNQTALKTRAAPFAVYIARMHRRIHELWGFGFLEDLDDKAASNPMNDWTLWTKIEVVINPDGTIDKTTIVRPSGQLTFDVAALDTVYTSGPYEAPPEAIRSKDGKTYVHWAFHRDWRQCGTFGAEPFILTTPRSGGDRGLDDGAILGRVPRRGGRDPAGHDHAHAGEAADARAASARATANLPAPDDPEAAFAANVWLTGFTKGDVQKMLKVSAVPFVSGGQVVASSGAEVAKVYAGILAESHAGVIRDWKLLSAAGYRKVFGALPEGVDGGGSELFLVVSLAREKFTVVLRETPGGDYKVVGFYR